MDWKDILTLLVPILGLLAWVYNRSEKKAEERYHKEEKKANERQAITEKKLDSLFTELSSIKDRLSRLEGRFDERGYWESREWHKTGTDDKK